MYWAAPSTIVTIMVAFVELGFTRTTTATVAAKAKVFKRSIYEVFSDKLELFDAAVREQSS
ncbi:MULTISPECIES: TetR family transcriptional regulator [unclassified Ensifer]|uniref:TetR family transcriptional regulator n=1 Tax=unclassified Ensifer TaxID=2633371 RepID=UPI0008134D7E|nr:MULTISPECIES: TetR family transcriptional regulator [unclassified Ensifer]OCP20540.1 hypothetical protein BC363_29805 [Ensifer sp. LC384]OCP20585.1 hypothetical protein BC361_28955 [Ensifer sp. LC54]